VNLFEENGVVKFRISLAERALTMRDPSAIEDLMAHQLVDVLRDVFGSKWSRMCQNLRKLTSDSLCLRVDLPAICSSSVSGPAEPAGVKDKPSPSGGDAMDT
jgi:hypothetical protein